MKPCARPQDQADGPWCIAVETNNGPGFAEDHEVGGRTFGERVAEFVQRGGEPGLADDRTPKPPGNLNR